MRQAWYQQNGLTCARTISSNDDSRMVCVEFEGSVAAPKLTAPESAALVMLAASILVFRTFRERYLLTWMLGWLAYFLSSWTVREGNFATLPRELVAISQVEFILAICLFAAAVFTYTHSRKLMVPLLGLRSQSWVLRRRGLCFGQTRWPSSCPGGLLSDRHNCGCDSDCAVSLGSVGDRSLARERLSVVVASGMGPSNRTLAELGQPDDRSAVWSRDDLYGF